MTDPWRLDGSAPEIYERYRVPGEFEPLARLFLTRMGLQRGERVLDVACGTGIVARLAAAQVGESGHVTGLDINEAMLDVARAKGSGSSTLEWRTGEAGSLPFAEREFDVVLCQQGLQFFADKLTALREMLRVLTPGGRLGLAVWQSLEHDPYGLVIADALSRHVSQDAADRAGHALGDESELRALLVEAGFCEVQIRTERLVRTMGPPHESVAMQLASSGRLAAIVGALSAEARAKLFSDIITALQPFRHGQGLRIPRGTFIALARR